MTMMEIRASRADLAWTCPLSSVQIDGEEPPLEIDETGDAASVGIVAHHALAHYLDPSRDGAPNVEELCAVHRIPDAEEEVDFLISAGLKMAERAHFRDAFREPRFEVPLVLEDGDVRIFGTADMLQTSPPLVSLNDWKTGRLRPDQTHQLRCYARLALEYAPTCTMARIFIGWVRDGEFEEYQWSLDDLDQWLDEFKRRMRNAVRANQYTPGPHCRFCPRAHSCEAKAKMDTERVLAIRDDPVVRELHEVELTPERIKELGPSIKEALDFLKYVGEMNTEIRDKLRSFIQQHGPIPVGETRELAVIDSTSTKLDPPKIMQAALEALGGDREALRACLSIRTSALKSAVMNATPHGEKAAAWEAFMERAEQLGAVSSFTSQKLMEKNRAK